MGKQHVIFEVSEKIATITLNRPEAKNALSTEMREQLDDALNETSDRAGDDVKALIITGAGGAFCAGGDVKNMNNSQQAGGVEANASRSRMRGSHSTIYNLFHIELPVITLVDGAAAGAGCNIALAGDFTLATPRAFFMQAFARIGLVPDWSGFYILPRLVGQMRAKELVFSGRRVYAEEAKEMGMIYDVVSQENALDEARAFASRFTHASTTAIGVAKNVLNQSYNQDHRTLLEMEAAGQSICRDTEFHKEAVRRFADKETPLYNWESFK